MAVNKINLFTEKRVTFGENLFKLDLRKLRPDTIAANSSSRRRTAPASILVRRPDTSVRK